jgi:hypothetical protein
MFWHLFPLIHRRAAYPMTWTMTTPILLLAALGEAMRQAGNDDAGEAGHAIL